MPRLTYKLLCCKSSRKKRTSQDHNMPRFTYKLSCKSSRKNRISQDHDDSKKHKKCLSTTNALLVKSNEAANKQRRHVKASKRYRGIKPIEFKRHPWFSPPTRRFWYPVPMGRYSPGTEPVHIPYHLYILVKQVVDINTRFKRSQIRSHLRDMEQVEDKIRFFCLYFYCHLPRGWEYNQDNASSLIAGYDTFFAKDGPRYDLSGYTPFRGKLKSGDDTAETMSIVHSRKTPTPETFKEWSWLQITFYCQLCSCFGIDYQHLETASEDDVCLMYVGS